MASSPDAARLTELHRQAQGIVGERTIGLMSRAWSLVDPLDVDGSWSRWFPTVAAIVRTQAATSAELSAGYYSTFRRLEIGAELAVEPAPAVSADSLAGSMRVTGPGAVKRAQRTTTTERAMEIGRAMSSRSAQRLALSGGRNTIDAAVASDRVCLGYYRATGGVACAFCAMLASRGAAYKSQDSATFQAHDGCNCSAEPLFADADSQLPPGTERYRDLWDDVTSGMSGADARNAFRRALAAR